MQGPLDPIRSHLCLQTNQGAGPRLDDNLVKNQVLDYLNTWMGGVTANSEIKGYILMGR
jgi:hypothetical protein